MYLDVYYSNWVVYYRRNAFLRFSRHCIASSKGTDSYFATTTFLIDFNRIIIYFALTTSPIRVESFDKTIIKLAELE